MNVLLVIRIPKAVVHAVETDINKVKVVPLFGAQKMPDHIPLFAAHFEDLISQPLFLVGAKSCHVSRIIANELIDLFLDLSGVSELVGRRIRRKKASHADAIDLARRKTWRHAHNHRLLALLPEIIPDCRCLDRG